MANYCINCGKKISLFDESIKLNYADCYFCENCKGTAEQLLTGIKTVLSRERLEDVKKEFAEALPAARLNEKAKQAVKKDFERRADIAERETIRLQSGIEGQRGTKKVLRASFEEAKEAILQVGKRLCGDGPPTALDVIKAGDAMVGVFIYESYFFRNGSYASLTVVLVSREDVSTILAVGSGGGDGILGISWGAEEDFEFSFWQEFQQLFPQYPLEDRMMEGQVQNRIGVLGGTFDPIHKGHIALAEGAIRAASLQKLIVMPAKVQPFKLGKEITEDYHRLAMVKAAFSNNERVEVSDYELNHTYISYTYDTLAYLRQFYRVEELFFIVGTDAFLELEYWHKGTDLLDSFSFIVGNRPGYRENELDRKIEHYQKCYHTHIIKVAEQMPDISSTMIKERLRAGLSVSQWIPEEVERYIDDQRLYL